MANIFNKNLFRQKFTQIDKSFNADDLYLHKFSEQIIVDKVSHASKKFANALIYGLFDSNRLPENVMEVTHANIKAINFYKEQKEFDEENNTLEARFDLIISNLTMQYNNDVVGALIQYYNILSENGMFLCNFLGGDTLKELKYVMLKTDIECFNKVFPRVIPMIEIKQMGTLMQRAGFDVPFCASEPVIVEYPNVDLMLKDLKYMALGNYIYNRTFPYNKKYFEQLEMNYIKEFSKNDKLEATFEVITAFGSKPPS